MMNDNQSRDRQELRKNAPASERWQAKACPTVRDKQLALVGVSFSLPCADFFTPSQGAVVSRRDLLKAAGFAMAASQAHGEPQTSVTPADWLKTCRALICEAYNPPFYPSFDFKAEKAVSIATALNAD